MIYLLISLFGAVTAWTSWYRDLSSVNPLRSVKNAKFILSTVPVICLALIAAILVTLSSTDVKRSPVYIGFYLALGAAWLGGSTLLFPFIGISARDDVLERSNVAALWAVSGALLGAACAFAGANIGNGPDTIVVIFCASLSSALFFALWLALDAFTSFSESITIERDTGAGIRLGGALIAIGLLSGWSVAGDWVSFSATVGDFARDSWPAILIASLAAVVERTARARRGNFTAFSPFISAVYVTLALIWIVALGVRS